MNALGFVPSILTRVCIHPFTQVCKEIIVEMTRASAGAMVKE